MELDKGRADRSYQYGRLLAVLEKVERDTYDKDESRDPNAIRLQSMFRRRPLHTFGIVNDQLERAYFPRLKPVSRSYYKHLISEIVEIIYACPESEWDKPLEDTYLMGYYLQRKDLYTAKTEKREIPTRRRIEHEHPESQNRLCSPGLGHDGQQQRRPAQRQPPPH